MWELIDEPSGSTIDTTADRSPLPMCRRCACGAPPAMGFHLTRTMLRRGSFNHISKATGGPPSLIDCLTVAVWLSGATSPESIQAWMLGDQVYMARVTPTVEDIADKSKWYAPRNDCCSPGAISFSAELPQSWHNELKSGGSLTGNSTRAVTARMRNGSRGTSAPPSHSSTGA